MSSLVKMVEDIRDRAGSGGEGGADPDVPRLVSACRDQDIGGATPAPTPSTVACAQFKYTKCTLEGSTVPPL